ncbi:alpha-ribazole phosphatase family protein [Caballeronia sordidicola]|jgi:alpha-ribazole phosphatase|uniref:Alpha-ribazole-5'-phosphate phosphatase n=1 Tax=Caballeronia sordidicola TaxID=196367 RepID=A0A226WVE2_CABSO|nr:alpha-ribazole phosphatase family protein [Caballeronia sordidicola]OXC75142.1 Alpha-ribazole-5'-phosphate phosphatase [Caballeronia sordidicola]
MDLVLIRHPAVGIDTGICYGRTDVPLLGDAADSARVLEERLRLLKVPAFDGVWHTSPLSRCRLLAEALGTVQADPRLQELDFGAWEGQRWDGLDRVMLDAWAKNLEHAREHGGESVAQFAERVVGWTDSMRIATATGPIHAVTHAGVIRVLTAHLLGVSRANAIQWPLDFGAIVWLKRVRDEWLLVRWNA